MSERARARRVAEVIRHELADLFSKGLKDPRIGFVSIMGVRMSSDLRYANVYVSLFGSDKEKRASMAALKNATGWIRREVGGRVRLHHTPEIRFFEDDSLERVFHLEEVFQKLHEQEDAESRDDMDQAGGDDEE